MSQSQDLHVNHDHHQPHPATPRRYPSTLTLGQPQQTHHKYEGFEELLRQAGYKETRVFTPPRECERERLSPNPKERDGDAANSKNRLGGVVGFLAGLIPRSTTPTPNPTTTPSATPTTTPYAPPSPASIQSSGCASDDEVLFDSPTTIKTIVPPLPTQQEIRRMGSTTTLNSQYQPKYLRSQHLQAKRQFSDAGTGLMPPQPPILNHQQLHQRHSYSHLNRPSRPASPSPLSRPGTPHRPTTPHRHSSHSHTSSNSHVTPFHPAPLYPASRHSRPTTPAPVRAPTPSKAHAYLRHMASARGLAIERDDGEDTPRPLPRTIAPKSKSTSSSSGSGSSSSRSGSQASSTTTVELESSSSDEEDTGTYLRRMRSLSRTGSRCDEPPQIHVEAKSNWEKAMEAVGGRRILRHSQSNTSATSSTTSKPMTDQTNRQSFAPPSRPTTPYLVTRLSSTEQSRGRGRDGGETRVNVYCRSRSVPPPRSRKRRGQPESEAHAAPVMVFHNAFIDSNAPVPSVWVDSPEDEPSAALDGSTHAPQPQRQNSIRSLRRHLHSTLVRDPDAPPLPIADRKSWSVRSSSARERGAVEGLWE